MQFGVTLPCLDPRMLASLAKETEDAGWDGVFVWDMIWGIDVWVSLAAVAMSTQRIRFGTMLTPLSRRRPWKVASEVVTLDHLSNGRVILPVGLGAVGDGHENNWFEQVGEETDRKTRAALLDESLDIITGLWSGQAFSYDGQHYHIQHVTFTPTPVQTPRVPIWVVGAWPRMKSMRRVLRCDGILPMKMHADKTFADLTPADIQAIKQFVHEQRTQDTPFEIIMEDETPGDEPQKAADIVQSWAAAGASWWLEAVWKTPEAQGGIEGMRKRVKQGPPRSSH